MNFIITAVISLVLYSNAVEGSIKCCGPKQWMSGVAQVVGAYNIDQDYYGLAEVVSTFYYDYQHKKVAALQTVTNETAEPVTRQIKQILDYNMMTKWVINGQNCAKMNIIEEMPPPCIPDSATHISSQTLASEPVDVWFTKYKSGTRVRATITQQDCILVTSSTLTGKPDFVMTVSLYQNMTAGPIDQKIFEVPSFCQKNLKPTGDVPVAIPWM